MGRQDELGPELIVEVADAQSGMQGVLVIDNTVLGPCGGGTRMAADVTVEEIAELARGMTYKFAIFGLPRGGSKAGIRADPRLPAEQKRAVLRAFGRRLGPLLRQNEVAIGPDMGVGVEDVAEIYAGAEVKNARSGLFRTPVDGDPAAYHFTGRGVAMAAKTVYEKMGHDFAGATVALEGFGQVGAGAARYAALSGAKIVAVSTLEGCIVDPKGLDIDRLLALRRSHGDRCVLEYGAGDRIDRTRIYFLEADIVIPGARPHVIDGYSAREVQAKLVCAAANIAVTPAGEDVLLERGIHSVPDFVANAGGALASWVDFLGGSYEDAFGVIDRLIGNLASDLWEEAPEGKSLAEVARARVRNRLLTAPRQRKSFDEIRSEIRGLFGL